MIIGDLVALIFILLISFIFIFPQSSAIYKNLYSKYPVLLSFFKFALLATFGEMLVLRIKEKKYYKKEAGFIPKMIIWGILGIFIYFAFIIFSKGVNFLVLKGTAPETIGLKIFNAFMISFFMNIIFAPVMMLAHNITDIYISENNGKFPLNKFYPLNLLKKVDWNKMWGFVFKKTIPFFWIPAHTITFLLPSQFRVLFAAFLSIILGLFLALAGKKN